MAEALNENEPDERLLRLRDELALIDSGFSELDGTDPDDQLELLLAAALVRGDGMSIESGGDCRTDTVLIGKLGDQPDGRPLFAVSIGSSDGVLAPHTADFAAVLIRPQFDAEVERLTGAQS